MTMVNRCLTCGGVLAVPQRSDRARCTACRRVRVRAFDARVHPTLPFELDVAAQRFVEDHPNGATLEEIGAALGLTRERVRQIEEIALAKIRKFSPVFVKENAA